MGNKQETVLIQINDKTWIEVKKTANHKEIKKKWINKLGSGLTLSKITPLIDHAALKREQRRKKKEEEAHLRDTGFGDTNFGD